MSTLILKRIANPAYPRDLSGRGAQITGGRWNEVGQPALYAAPGESTVLVEWFVHRKPFDKLFIPRASLMTLEVDVPASDPSVHRIALGDLPADLTGAPGRVRCRELGAAWLRAGRDMILEAPSVNAPSELIHVLNPLHPHFASRVRLVSEVPFAAPSRLSIGYDLSDSQIAAIASIIGATTP